MSFAENISQADIDLRATKNIEAAWMQQIESIQTCQDLAEFSNSTFPVLQKLTTDIQHQIAKYTTLTVAPTTLVGVIAWIATQVELYGVPLANSIHQAELILSLSARLAAAIESKSNGLQCNVSLPVPTVIVET